jgi:predicted HAD superfamily phosphohydrolase YqeG
MGMVTILVTPLAKREFLGTRITRQLERLVLKRLKGPGCPEL